MSILSSFSEAEKQQLLEFQQLLEEKRILNEISKLKFGRAHVARFLYSQQFAQEGATSSFEKYLEWRGAQHIDKMLEQDVSEMADVKRYLPHGYHQVDTEGRPVYILQVGQIHVGDLFDSISMDKLLKYFFKEIEEGWRERCFETAQVLQREIDQVLLIVDLEGAKLKDLSSKQLQTAVGSFIEQVSMFYPEFLHRAFILNAPMFFSDVWDDISPFLSKHTLGKVVISGESSHADLKEMVTPENLPAAYGGLCKCKATCVFSDKGPWSPTENFVNYALNEEEFKYEDEEEEEEGCERGDFEGIRNAVQFIPSIPSAKNKFSGNDESERLKAQLGMLFGEGTETPSQTPMNTQIEEENV